MRESIINYLTACLIATPIYLLIRRPWLKNDKREVILAIFFVYLAGLFAVTLRGTYQLPLDAFKNAVYRIKTLSGINIVPIKYIISYFKYATLDEFMLNFVSNIVIFIPWGFGTMLLWQKNHKPIRLIALLIGITVFIEVFQIFIGRSFDIDDIILNFSGGLIGAIIYIILLKLKPNIIEIAK